MNTDGLIARLKIYGESDGKVIFPTFQRLCNDAAAALVQLRDSEALARGKIAEQMIELGKYKDEHLSFLARTQRAEAEVARLQAQASAVAEIIPPREPTHEMDDAASNVDRSNLPGVFRRQVWRAMWDASGVAKASVITGNKP